MNQPSHAGVDFDKAVIAYFNAHHTLPANALSLPQDHLKELLDSIPMEHKDLRREIANAGGFR